MSIFTKLHLFVGCLGILAFLLTGQYMDHYWNHLEGMEDGRRMLYRSAHIYLLLTSFANLMVAVYAKNMTPKVIEWLCSIAITLSPLCMLLEFFYGATSVDEHRHFAYYSLVSLFTVGILLTGKTLLYHLKFRKS